MVEYVYAPVVAAARLSFAGLGLKIDLRGTENVPRRGGAVLASNHVSYLDFIYAGLGAHPSGRYVRFMAKDSVWKNPVAGPLMRGMKHIPVDRDAGTAAFRDAVRDLRAGELVGIFPEATMSRSLEIKEIKNGAVRIARTANVPLIPMIVFGGQRILSYGHRDLHRGRTIVIMVGEPLATPRGVDVDVTTQALHDRLAELLDLAIARYPDKPAGATWIPARLGGGAPTPEEALAIEERVRAEKAQKAASGRDAEQR